MFTSLPKTSVVFFISYHGIHENRATGVPLLSCLISSLLIGALYPLTQIYQHEADKKDGVTTLSYVLGKKGSFVFSGFLFSMATLLLYLRFQQQDQPGLFIIYLLATSPVVLFFLYWMRQVWKDGSRANFKNSLFMNVIATVCMTGFFLTLIILKM